MLIYVSKDEFRNLPDTMSIQLNNQSMFINEMYELPHHRFLTRFTVLCISAETVDLQSNSIEIGYPQNIHLTIASMGISCHDNH